MADVEQWVNLPKEANLKDATYATTTERMGAVYPLLRFKEKNPAAVKYRIVPDSENLTYDANEIARNANFALRARGAFVSDGSSADIDPDVPLDIPACGGNKYKIEALDGKGNVVETSDTILARRILHCRVAAMRSPLVTSKADIDWLIDEAAKALWKDDRSVRLLRVGASGELDPTAVHEEDDKGPEDPASAYGKFLAAVDKKVSSQLKSTAVGFVLVWVPSLAKKKRSGYSFPVPNLEPGGEFLEASNARLKVGQHNGFKRLLLLLPGDTYFWRGFDKVEDDDKHWFATGWITFKTPAGDQVGQPLTIHKDMVSLVSTPAPFNGHGYRTALVDLAKYAREIALFKGFRAEVTFVARVVSSWSHGHSVHRNKDRVDPQPWKSGVVVMASTAKWKALSKERQLANLVHELGHRMGLVASGNKDKTQEHTPNADDATFYDRNTNLGKGHHEVPHCKKSMTWSDDEKEWKGTPGCVMFGVTVYDKNDKEKDLSARDYCAACSDALRRSDLSNVAR